MCAPMLIKIGPKYYKVEDMLLYLFCHALSDEDQSRFFREYEVDEHGEPLVPDSLRG